MSAIIVGQSQLPFPIQFGGVIFETQTGYGNAWEIEPDLLLERCTVRASSTAPDTCQVVHKYGEVKMTYEEAYQERTPWDTDGMWLRMSIGSPQGLVPVFVGFFEGEGKEMTGSQSLAAGEQTFTAKGGLRLLEKIDIAGAWFYTTSEGTPLQMVDWIPPMNKRDKRGLLVGNMSVSGASFYYGGTQVWNHLDYVLYLLANFLNTPGSTGPVWTLGGQSDILANIETSIEFPQSITAAQMLRQLIPVRYGIDYGVFPTDDGFEIRVFALSDQTVTFGDVTMPGNPSTITLDRLGQPELFETQLVRTSERRVDRIQVRGRRIIVCGTLNGSNIPTANNPLANNSTSLVPKWSSPLEDDYTTAGGLTSSMPTAGNTIFDQVRARQKYRDVYQHLGTPDNWDLAGGSWAVQCMDDGTPMNGAIVSFQTAIRETLPWIPLKVGNDYSTDPPTDNTLGSADEPDMQGIIAWVYDQIPLDGSAPRYIQCNLNGMHVQRPWHDWGVIINPSPNHLLALNHWSDAQAATSNVFPRYDYTSVVATIAIESDHRIGLGYSVPAGLAAGDGTVKTIIDDSAEMWVLLPNTVVDVDPTGAFLTSGSNLRVLRNDISRLALVMAGALARYAYERTRAHIGFKGFQPWGPALGSILSVVQQGDDVQQVGSPITSIDWIMKPTPQTLVKTGYA